MTDLTTGSNDARSLRVLWPTVALPLAPLARLPTGRLGWPLSLSIRGLHNLTAPLYN